MEGLLTLLLFAGVFDFMMRFGCGAHMVHGHGGPENGHGGHTGHDEATGGMLGQGAPATDPVCGMQLAPGQGYPKMHAGREYRLGSRACLDKFEASPDQYASVHGGAR
jgi:YHS domain-containing protein